MKKYIVAALCLLVLLALTACVSDGNDPEITSALPETSVTAPAETLTEETSAEEETAADENIGRAGADMFDENADYGKIIISSYYATGDKTNTPVNNGYIELYNTSDEDIRLAGLALYYSHGGGEYRECRFTADSVIPAGGWFLIACADPMGSVRRADSPEVFGLANCDLTSSIRLYPEDSRLVIARAESILPAGRPLTETDGIFEWFSTCESDSGDIYRYESDLTANKLARKKARIVAAGYDKINLTKASYTLLQQVCPKYTGGNSDADVTAFLPEVRFSADGGLYGEGFPLLMTAPDGYEIYYTVNGEDPRNGNAVRYTGALNLPDTSAMPWGELVRRSARYSGSFFLPLVISQPGGICVKAYATDGHTETGLTVATYFIGTKLGEYGLDFANVTVEPDEFISESNGIYNLLLKDEDGGHTKAEAYFEYFSADGTRRFASWTQIAMNGKGSLGMAQRSFRVLFKSDAAADVSENLSAFDYNLYGEYATKTPDGGDLTYYKRILFRNGGGDNSGCTISRSHIGDAYIARIDGGMNVDVMAYTPVMMFVNGEFWGIFNARERFDSKYFETAYNLPEEDVVMLECPYPILPDGSWCSDGDYIVKFGQQSDADDFNAMVRFIASNDMSVPENYQAAAAQLDLDNFIDHFCAQMYLCCSDWPTNNIKVWRNNGKDNGFDNKWRFCIVDTDHGVGLNSTYSQNMIAHGVNTGTLAGRMMVSLLNNPEFREKFITRYIWCAEVHFAPGRTLPMLDEIVDKLTPVMKFQLDRWRVTDGTATSWDKWYSYIEIIREFMQKRAPYAEKHLQDYFGLTNQQMDEYRNKVKEINK